MAQYKPGETGNKRGRPKGTKSKTGEYLRSLIQDFIHDHWNDLKTDWDKLKPRERWDLIEKLLRHTLPRPLHELEKLTDEQLDYIIQQLKRGAL